MTPATICAHASNGGWLPASCAQSQFLESSLLKRLFCQGLLHDLLALRLGGESAALVWPISRIDPAQHPIYQPENCESAKMRTENDVLASYKRRDLAVGPQRLSIATCSPEICEPSSVDEEKFFTIFRGCRGCVVGVHSVADCLFFFGEGWDGLAGCPFPRHLSFSAGRGFSAHNVDTQRASLIGRATSESGFVLMLLCRFVPCSTIRYTPRKKPAGGWPDFIGSS